MVTVNTSPSEIIRQNRMAEHIFNRYGIDVDNTNGIAQNTAMIEVNPDFLVDVLNIVCNHKKAQYKLFAKYPIPVILDYLKRSHAYYLEKTLPEIGQSIAILLNNYHDTHPLLEALYKFYFKYKVDLKEHISEEEEVLFPYAKRLYNATYFNTEISFFVDFLEQYSIHDFIKAHSDPTEDLTMVRTILRKYDPPITNKSSYRILKEKLKNFEQDLNAHAFIEDKVLVPRLYRLEQHLKLSINN